MHNSDQSIDAADGCRNTLETGGPAVSRNHALDFVKGMLVFFMIVYHGVNYFLPTAEGLLRYIRIIAGAYLLTAGFTLSHVVVPRHGGGLLSPARRSMARGLRLALVFGALNFAAIALVPGRVSGLTTNPRALCQLARSVFLRGDTVFAAFEVLLPIAYFMCLSSLLILLWAAGPLPTTIVAAACYAAVAAMAWWIGASYNMELVCLGVVGFAIGRAGAEELESFLRRFEIVVWVGYAALLAWVSLFSQPFVVYSLYVTVTVTWLYVVGRRWYRPRAARGLIALFARYTLVAYIVQIGFLRLLGWLLPGWVDRPRGLALALMVTVLVLRAFIGVVELSRKRIPAFNAAYRFVFG